MSADTTSVPAHPDLARFMAVLVPVIALAAAIAWAVAVGAGVFLNATDKDAGFLDSEAMKYVMPGLTALVGGVVAAAFGLAKSDKSDDNMASLARTATPGANRAHDGIAIAYISLYLLLGLAAAVIWAVKQGDTFEFLRTLAAAWVGLFLGIAQGYTQTGSQ